MAIDTADRGTCFAIDGQRPRLRSVTRWRVAPTAVLGASCGLDAGPSGMVGRVRADLEALGSRRPVAGNHREPQARLRRA